MHISNVYAHMCTRKYSIFRKQTHDTVSCLWPAVVNRFTQLPGCLSSAWPLKRRLRLRLRRWGFLSLSSVIAKFTMNYSDKNKTEANKKKYSFRDWGRGEGNLIINRWNNTQYWQKINSGSCKSIANRLKMKLKIKSIWSQILKT